MGMYDTFNGELEKVFPWYTFSDTFNQIDGHGGNLKYYGNGDNIPYRSLSRNYTKNFIILDIDVFEFLGCQSEHECIMHIIEDGILRKTVYPSEFSENINGYISSANYIISGYGEFIGNIHSVDDVYKYKNDLKIQALEKQESNRCRQIALSQILHELRELKDIKENTKEYKEKIAAINEMQKNLDEQSKAAESKIKKINEKFFRLWGIDNEEYHMYENFGMWIEAGIFILNAIERYQKSNEEYVKKYRKNLECYQASLKKQFENQLDDEEFLKGYIKWAEITADELIMISKLFEKIGYMIPY